MRLDEYLSSQKISAAKFARKLGVSHSLVHGWRHGTKLPSLPMALRIKSVTGDAVRPEDWPMPANDTSAPPAVEVGA